SKSGQRLRTLAGKSSMLSSTASPREESPLQRGTVQLLRVAVWRLASDHRSETSASSTEQLPGCPFLEGTVVSISEVRRFASDLQTNSALRAEIDKQSQSAPESLDGVIALAASKGYNFTAE